MGADLAVSFAQASAVALRGRQRHHRIQIALQSLAILAAITGGDYWRRVLAAN